MTERALEDELKAALAEKERLRQELETVRPLEGLGRLAGGIAHDLKNIFQIVMGHGELLRRRIPDDPRLIASLQHVAEAAERGAAAAETLMALSRARLPERSEVSLTEVVHAALSGGTTTVPAGVELQLHLEDPGPHVLGDAVALRRMVEELTRNALTALAGTGRIELSTGSVEPILGRPTALLQVRDSGPGIPADILEATHDRSFVSRRRTHAGLGLAVIDRIVRDHAGSEIETAPGLGTTVSCFFPQVEQPS